MRSIFSLTAFLVVCAAATGRAPDPNMPFPKDISAARYNVPEKGINRRVDVAVGAYVDDENRFIINGHQKGINFSILLGPVGTLAAAKANAAAGRRLGDRAVTDQPATVSEVAKDAILAEFGEGSKFVFDPEAEARFDIAPYAHFTIDKKDGSARLFAFLNVKLFASETDEDPVWASRFYGEYGNALSEAELQDPDTVVAALEEAFKRVAWGLSKIANDAFEQYAPQKIEARFAGMNGPFKIDGAVLSEAGGNLLVRVPINMVAPFGGYTAFDRASARLHPLKKFKDKHREGFER